MMRTRTKKGKREEAERKKIQRSRKEEIEKGERKKDKYQMGKRNGRRER